MAFGGRDVTMSDFDWECMECEHVYERRESAATCCTFPGPDYTSAKAIDPETAEEPSMWLGSKPWKFYGE